MSHYKDAIEIIKEMVPFADVSVKLTDSQIIFNNLNEKVSCVSNFLFLVAKYHIYRRRCIGNLPYTYAYKNEVYFYRNVEKYNVAVKNKVGKHNYKWHGIKERPNLDSCTSDQFISDYITEM